MTDTETVYECQNEACSLGTPGTPGRFTGGATKEQITNLTGNPEPDKHGEGVCPNCGKPGKKAGSEPVPHKGHDPYKSLHQQVQERVEDPDDKLNKDTAQDELVRLVEEGEDA